MKGRELMWSLWVGAVAVECFAGLALSAHRRVTLYQRADERYLGTALVGPPEDSRTAPLTTEQVTMGALLAGSPPSRGPADAPVAIIEFVDFECPTCRRFAEALAQLPERAKLRLVFRHHPFSFHEWARKAAAASICVDAQDHGAFWKLADFLFAHQGELTGENFDARVLPFLSDELHLNPAAVKSCLEKGEYEKALSEDERLAAQYDVRKTPMFFVNGRRFVGFRSAEELKSVIDAALGVTDSQPAASPSRTTP